MQFVEPTMWADTAWRQTLRNILKHGHEVSPRGNPTREILHASAGFNMHTPQVSSPARKVYKKFMAAEAYWILTGDNSVAGIEPYNRHIKQFSDNGVSFAGAYGPQFTRQLHYAVNCLATDAHSRQAVIQIWKENPGPSKDIPCTLNLTFNIRNGKLNCHAFMRSSDIWLGLPYDFFNFSMMALYVGMHLNELCVNVKLGHLYWTAVSSHMYEADRNKACKVMEEMNLESGLVIDADLISKPPEVLLNLLRTMRHGDWPEELG